MTNKSFIDEKVLIQQQLSFFVKASKGLTELEQIANLANIILFTLVETDKIAVAIIDGNILRSLNIIGERNFIDLNLDQPSVNARAIKSRKTQIINNTSIDRDYFPGHFPSKVEILSELCVPIIYEDEALGTINLESRHLANYSDRNAEVVEVFAKELAKIIHLGSISRKPTFSEAKIRTSHDLYIDVLAAVGSGELVATRILNSANISWKRGKKIINQLIEYGLLESKKISRHRKTYSLTEQGNRLLNAYRQARSGSKKTITDYMINGRLSSEEHEQIEDQLTQFMYNMEVYLNKKKRGYSLEKNLEAYSEYLVEYYIIDCASFCVNESRVEFSVEGFIFQNTFQKMGEAVDPLSFFLKQIIRETTGNDSEAIRVYSKDHLSIILEILPRYGLARENHMHNR